MKQKLANEQAHIQRKEFAEELVAKGELLLLQNQLEKALSAFERADDHFYRQGLALFEYGSEEGNEQGLIRANRAFKKAYALDPYDAEILQAWGNSLVLLGESFDEHHYILEAKEKYETAIGLCEDTSDLYWDYAIVWYHLGLQSEEAIDLQKSIRYFERTIEPSAVQPAEFWIDFGTTSLLLASKVNDVRHTVKAVNCFKKAVQLEPDSFDAWCSFAQALQSLYDYTHDDDHLVQTNEAFEKASLLAPNDPQVWTDWALFLRDAAKRTGDLRRLREFIEKSQQAYATEPEDPYPLALWAEGLATLGQLTDRLDLIYDAEAKIFQALDASEDEPLIWHCAGMCTLAFGAYFQDVDFYFQAIEKFQAGLSLDRTCVPLWLGLADSYYHAGNLDQDTEPLEQSLKFYEKALHLSPSSERHILYAIALSKLGEINHSEERLNDALYHFEMALHLQRNAVYLHPVWLNAYASTLDHLGDFHDNDKYYTRAIEIYSHIIMVDPDFPHIHHRLAQVHCHLGELTGDLDAFYRAIHHLRLARKRDEDNDQIILDHGIALVNLAQHTPILTDVEPLMLDAQAKMTRSAKLGNLQAYYHLACLHSLLGDTAKALHFLQKADQYQALPGYEELLADDWLENLRSTSHFLEFLEQHPHLTSEPD